MSENALLETTERNGTLLGPLPVDQAGNPDKHSESVAVEEKVYKVLVGIPLKGHTPPASYHDRMLMWKHMGVTEASDFYSHKSPRYAFALGCIGEIMVPFARERLAQSCIEVGADYLFMIDDDMLAPPDLFYQLVKHDKPIVAALAFTRNPDHKAVIYEVVEGFDPVSQQNYYVNKFVQNYPRNKLVECDAVGFGAVLIKAEVLRKMPEPRFMGLVGTGEDVTFCYKAKKLGFSVWMDTSVKLGHLASPTIITEEYSDTWNKLTPEQREKTYGQYTKYATEDIK